MADKAMNMPPEVEAPRSRSRSRSSTSSSSSSSSGGSSSSSSGSRSRSPRGRAAAEPSKALGDVEVPPLPRDLWDVVWHQAIREEWLDGVEPKNISMLFSKALQKAVKQSGRHASALGVLQLFLRDGCHRLACHVWSKGLGEEPGVVQLSKPLARLAVNVCRAWGFRVPDAMVQEIVTAAWNKAWLQPSQAKLRHGGKPLSAEGHEEVGPTVSGSASSQGLGADTTRTRARDSYGRGSSPTPLLGSAPAPVLRSEAAAGQGAARLEAGGHAEEPAPWGSPCTGLGAGEAESLGRHPRRRIAAAAQRMLGFEINKAAFHNSLQDMPLRAKEDPYLEAGELWEAHAAEDAEPAGAEETAPSGSCDSGRAAAEEVERVAAGPALDDDDHGTAVDWDPYIEATRPQPPTPPRRRQPLTARPQPPTPPRRRQPPQGARLPVQSPPPPCRHRAKAASAEVVDLTRD